MCGGSHRPLLLLSAAVQPQHYHNRLGPFRARTNPIIKAHLLRVLDLLRLEAVEGHEGDAPALAAAQLRRQAQRRVIVLHLA